MFKSTAMCGYNIATEEERSELLNSCKNGTDDFDTNQEALQVLAASCPTFKEIHPLNASKYKNCSIKTFLQVLNYHIDLEVKYNEYGYSLEEDARIIIKDV